MLIDIFHPHFRAVGKRVDKAAKDIGDEGLTPDNVERILTVADPCGTRVPKDIACAYVRYVLEHNYETKLYALHHEQFENRISYGYTAAVRVLAPAEVEQYFSEASESSRERYGAFGELCHLCAEFRLWDKFRQVFQRDPAHSLLRVSTLPCAPACSVLDQELLPDRK